MNPIGDRWLDAQEVYKGAQVTHPRSCLKLTLIQVILTHWNGRLPSAETLKSLSGSRHSNGWLSSFEQSVPCFFVLILWKVFAKKLLLITVDFDEDSLNVDEDNDDEQPRRVIPVTPGSGHFARGRTLWGTLHSTLRHTAAGSSLYVLMHIDLIVIVERLWSSGHISISTYIIINFSHHVS